MTRITWFPRFMNTRHEPRHEGRQERILISTIRGTYKCGTWWLILRFDAFRPKGHGFELRSRRHVGTLGKSFTHSFLWRLGVKLRRCIRAVSGAPLSNSGLEVE